MSTTTDRDGFPTTECRRCGGTGRYSFNLMDGSRCYGCGGTGRAYTTKRVAEQVAALRTARRQAAERRADQLQRGTELRDGRVVTRVTDLGEPVGWSGNHAEAKAAGHIEPRSGRLTCSPTQPHPCWDVMATRHVVTYTDGSSELRNGNELVKVVPQRIDPAPYLAAAGL